MQSWNALDWLLAGLVLFSTIAGLLRGLIRTLFGLAGLFCGFAVAGWQYGNAAAWAVSRGWITSREIAGLAAYVLIAVMVMILFGMLGSLVRRTAHAAGLGSLDRMAGAAVGALRGILLGAAIAVGINAVAPRSELMRTSQLSFYFLAAAHAISFVLPHSLH